MKAAIQMILLLLSILSVGCGNIEQINGHSIKTATKSVAVIKERLPANLRIEFEIAYWSIRKQISDDGEFLKTVDQKKPTDIIELGKQIFDKNKASGLAEVAKFDSWEQMIAQQIELRGEQDRSAVDVKDKKGYPRVDYKLRSM